MKLKLFKVVALCICAVLTIGTVAGCSSTDVGPNIDTSKTQVYVANYAGGVGRTWLDEAVTRFEKYYENESFEAGKTGVQVQIKNDKDVAVAQMKGSSHYIFFIPVNQFYQYISEGDFVKITDIVQERLPGESKSIEDKLSADTKAALTALDGDYYLLPTAQSVGGVTYNVHLFEDKGLFFADNSSEAPIQNSGDPRYGFILTSKNLKRSTGPDGLYGTEDDGLPSSVEEFKKLCDCMVKLNVTPFICYAYSYHYTQCLLQSLWANLAGYNELALSISADSSRYGTTDIVEINSNGKIVKENNNIKIVKGQEINANNGYLLSRQVSRYYALDFLQYIFSPERINTYLDRASLTAALSHTDAQYNFMRGEPIGKPIGMLIEGSYWENETKDAGNLNTMKELYPDYYEEMNYRFMPMPHQYSGRIDPIGTVGESGVTERDGYKQVAVDNLYNYAVINANTVKRGSVAERVSKLFLQFLYTDESLRKATTVNGMSKDVEYELSDSEYASLSGFAKSVYDIKKNGQIFVPISNSRVFVQNMSAFSFSTLSTQIWSTGSYSYPLNAFKDGVSLDNFFESLVAEHSSDWWNKLNK